MLFRDLLERFSEIGTFQGVKISKSYHCSKARKGTCVTRDGGMTKTKYSNIINLAIKKGLDLSKESYITWRKKSKYNGMILTDPYKNSILVKTVMLGQKTKVLSKVKTIDITDEYSKIYKDNDAA